MTAAFIIMFALLSAAGIKYTVDNKEQIKKVVKKGIDESKRRVSNRS